jgi:Domain of unknown function (DUF4340)
MKGRQLAIVLILLVALGAVAWFLNRRNSESWRNSATSAGEKILNFPLNDVAHITIKGAGAELNLVKKGDAWRVAERADYPANFEKVSGLLRKVWELHPVQDVKVGPSQLQRLQLTQPTNDPNSSMLLDLQDAKGKRVGALLAGKKQMRDSDEGMGARGGLAAGRYIMPEDGSNRVFAVSQPLEELQTKPEQWLNRDFIKIENPRLISVAGQGGVNWTVTRESSSAPWKLVDPKPGEELDKNKTAGLATLFSYAYFADVLAPNASPAETGLDHPTTAHIETFDNFTYDLKIGKPNDKNYPVLVSVQAQLPKARTPGKDEKPEEKSKLEKEFEEKQKRLTEKLAKEQKLENRPYLMSKSTVDQLLKDRGPLMATPTPTPSAAPAASVPGKAGVPPARPPLPVPHRSVPPRPTPAPPPP